MAQSRSKERESGAQVIEIGAPFSGMTDVLDPGQPQTVYAANVLCRNGYFDAAPWPRDLPRTATIPCKLGQWMDKEDSSILRLYLGHATPYTDESHVVLTVDRSGESASYDLTTLYGEQQPVNTHYSFAAFQRWVYFCGGQWVYRINRDTLKVEPLTLQVNPDPGAADTPYLTGWLCASQVEVHLGSLWFVIPRRVTAATSTVLSTTDPRVKDKTRIVGGGLDLHPTDVVYTDAYTPDSISAYSYWSAEGDGSQLQAIKSWGKRLVLWTKIGIYDLTGTDESDWMLECIQRGAGCAAPASVAVVGDSLFWQGIGHIHVRSQAEGIKAIAGTSWLWGTYAGAMRGLVELAWDYHVLPGMVTPPFLWQPVVYGQGANFADTHYWLTGKTATLVAEAATGAVSFLFQHWDWISDGRNVDLYGAKPVLIGSYTNLGAKSVVPGDSIRGTLAPVSFWPWLLFRLPFKTAERATISAVQVRMSDVHCGGSYSVIALDDAVRLGSTSAPNKDDEKTGGAFLSPPGGTEEVSAFDGTGVKWDAAGVRWAPSGPVTYTGRARATGTDFLVRLSLSGRKSFALEKVAVIVAKVEVRR